MSDKSLYTIREATGYLALSESSFQTAVAPHCRKLSPVPGRVAWAREEMKRMDAAKQIQKKMIDPAFFSLRQSMSYI